MITSFVLGLGLRLDETNTYVYKCEIKLYLSNPFWYKELKTFTRKFEDQLKNINMSKHSRTIDYVFNNSSTCYLNNNCPFAITINGNQDLYKIFNFHVQELFTKGSKKEILKFLTYIEKYSYIYYLSFLCIHSNVYDYLVYGDISDKSECAYDFLKFKFVNVFQSKEDFARIKFSQQFKSDQDQILSYVNYDLYFEKELANVFHCIMFKNECYVFLK